MNAETKKLDEILKGVESLKTTLMETRKKLGILSDEEVAEIEDRLQRRLEHCSKATAGLRVHVQRDGEHAIIVDQRGRRYRQTVQKIEQRLASCEHPPL